MGTDTSRGDGTSAAIVTGNTRADCPPKRGDDAASWCAENSATLTIDFKTVLVAASAFWDSELSSTKSLS
jgi:hypothetical protein